MTVLIKLGAKLSAQIWYCLVFLSSIRYLWRYIYMYRNNRLYCIHYQYALPFKCVMDQWCSLQSTKPKNPGVLPNPPLQQLPSNERIWPEYLFPPLWALMRLWYCCSLLFVSFSIRSSLLSFLSFCLGVSLRFSPNFEVWLFVSFDVVQIVEDDGDSGGGDGLSVI